MMGYNLSRHSVIRNRPQLDQLMYAVESGASIHFPASTPGKLAYKLREAIKAAAEHEEFKHYAEALAPRYIFKEEKFGVRAEYQENPIGEVLTGEPTIIQPQTKKLIPDALEYLDIIGAALQFKTESELYFPNVVMSPADRLALYKWTADQPWKYIDHEGAGVTLTKRDVPSEVLWREPNA